jgi:spore maturation protein SpmA
MAVRRAVGYVVLLALAGAVFYGLNAIDNQLIFIEGTADLVVRIIIGLITLYILWLGTGQPILSGNGRQTIGDKFADTLVTVRKS